MKYVFHAVFLRKIAIAPHTFECTFKVADSAFSFRSGQYVWVILPSLIAHDPRGARRAFSLTNPPQEKETISIVFRASSSGFKQTLLSLNPGDPLTIEGPFGSSYVVLEHQSHPTVFIAGGSGIAPFLSYIRSSQPLPFSNLTLITSNKSQETTCFTDEVAILARAHKFEHINHIGLYEGIPLSPELFSQNTHVYVCGPKQFVLHIYDQLKLTTTPIDQIHFEQFYPESEGNLTPEEFSAKTGRDNFMLRAIEDSKNHVVITDINGFIIYANPTAEKNTGYTLAEMRGNTPRLWGGLMSPEFYKNFWLQKKQTGGFDGEIMNRRKNGQLYHVLVHISSILSENKQIIGYIGTEEDITYRFQLEQNLREEKQRTEAMLFSLGEGVIAHDKNETIVFMNPPVTEMLGYEVQDLVGQRFVDMVHAQDLTGKPIPIEKRPILRARGEMKRIIDTLVYIKKNGSKVVVRVVHSPIIIHGEYFGNIQIMTDVTKEKEIDRAKTEFISLASHQLRTPLSTINWYTEMLINGDAGPINIQQKSFLDEIYTGAQRMVKLVNALLNVSRIESNTFIIEPELIDMVKLIKSIVGESQPNIIAKQLDVQISEVDLPKIMLDLNLATMIFQNLITNAIKYTNRQGHIQITVLIVKKGEMFGGRVQQSNMLAFTVTDNGMGIPDNQQHEIFQKLFRADNVKRADTEGTGLGLHLIKSLIEHCHGEIWFSSREHEGTSFFVTLPESGMPKKEGIKKINE